MTQDYAETLRWYRLAADQGNADAQVSIDRFDQARVNPQTIKDQLVKLLDSGVSTSASLERQIFLSRQLLIHSRATDNRLAMQRVLASSLLKYDELVHDPRILGEATAAYQEAALSSSREEDPEIWADIQIDFGYALVKNGTLIGDLRALAASATAFRNAQQVYTKEREPQQWAKTYSNLGVALSTIGELTSDLTLISDAAVAYKHALEVYTPRGVHERR